MSTINKNLLALRKEIEKTGRSDVELVAVTKTRSLPDLIELFKAGVRHVGENRLEEIALKFQDGFLRSAYPNLRLHLIGHLQRRRVADAISLCDTIDSVDSIRLAESISRRAAVAKKTMYIMLEVNVSGEVQKYGFTPEEIIPAAKEIVKLPNLRVYGLMCMAPLTDDEDLIRNVFKGLAQLRDEIVKNEELKNCQALSMGMSHDYKIALECGSNYLRVGSLLFQ